MTPAAPPPLHIILAAHGSTEHPGAAELVRACGDAIRTTALPGVGDIIEAFWLGGEFPLREALDRCPAGDALIVPLLMNDGYFSETVFPRELAPERPRAHLRHVEVAPPLGLHPRFEPIVQQRMEAACLAHQARHVLLVGHGTERDARSARRTRELAEHAQNTPSIQAAGIRIDVAFLDQAPYLRDTLRDAPWPNDEPLVLVPWFTADGAHAALDIPELVQRLRPAATIVEASVGAQAFPTLCREIVEERLVRGNQ